MRRNKTRAESPSVSHATSRAGLASTPASTPSVVKMLKELLTVATILITASTAQVVELILTPELNADESFDPEKPSYGPDGPWQALSLHYGNASDL
jgi:hypothetical protein